MAPFRTADDRNSKPRQDPVSCKLCRLKKLKCDRQRPCSNCQTRGLTCEYKGQPPLPPLATSGATNGDQLDYRTENQNLRARLQRLEEAVFGESSPNDNSLAEQNHASLPTAAPTPSKPRIEDKKADEDSNWLEAIGNRADAVLPQFNSPLNINICPLEYFLNPVQKYSSVRNIDIPTYDVVTDLLDAYSDHLDAVQHIMHVEFTRDMISKVYTQVHARQVVDPGALAFILSLCANVGFYWTVGMYQITSAFQDGETALRVSTEWVKQAMVAIELARNGTTTTSLEAIQGSILLMFFLYHVEGGTFRVRMMHATTVAMARDLELHKTDLPGSRPQTLTQADIIALEVRRKLWWHLSCTDWFLSFIGGPHEGVFSIHPGQAKVELPRNITRQDLETRGPDFQRSISEPTLMSYYLQRVKLAHTCREITETLFKLSDATEADYDKVRMLDSKFELQLQELPRFLRYDLPAEQLKMEYGDAYDQQTSMQAVMINLMLATRRCKLHLPYLIRAKTNPRYVFSRRMGLQAARLVFNVRRVVMEDKDSTNALQLKLGGIRQHIFYATVILVMDLCVNRNDDDPGQLAEVREALKIIQEGKGVQDSLHMGDRFYESLLAVLQKHHVKLASTNENRRQAENKSGRLPPMPSHDTSQSYQTRPNQSMGPTDGIIGCSSYMAMPPAGSNPFANQDNTQSSGLAFDGSMWADFLQQGPMLDAQDWDALLTDLDMRMI